MDFDFEFDQSSKRSQLSHFTLLTSSEESQLEFLFEDRFNMLDNVSKAKEDYDISLDIIEESEVSNISEISMVMSQGNKKGWWHDFMELDHNNRTESDLLIKLKKSLKTRFNKLTKHKLLLILKNYVKHSEDINFVLRSDFIIQATKILNQTTKATKNMIIDLLVNISLTN